MSAKDFRCDICKREFATKHSLERHTSAKQKPCIPDKLPDPQGKWECPYCFCHYDCASKLRQHIDRDCQIRKKNIYERDEYMELLPFKTQLKQILSNG